MWQLFLYTQHHGNMMKPTVSTPLHIDQYEPWGNLIEPSWERFTCTNKIKFPRGNAVFRLVACGFNFLERIREWGRKSVNETESNVNKTKTFKHRLWTVVTKRRQLDFHQQSRDDYYSRLFIGPKQLNYICERLVSSRIVSGVSDWSDCSVKHQNWSKMIRLTFSIIQNPT